MKLFFRILKIFAVLVIAVTVTLFTAAFFMQDKVTGIILKSFNKNFTTKYSIGSTHLSFIRKFPKASLDLKDVVVFSSPGFDRLGFNCINTDTLLSAKIVRAEFTFTDILKGVYNIDRMSVMEGRLNLFSDTSGNVNYTITADTSDEESDFTLNLDRINVSDITAVYENLATKLLIKGTVDEGRLKTRISGSVIDFMASGGGKVTLFRLYNFSIEKPLAAKINVNLHSTDQGVLFEKSTLIIDNYDLGLSGFISSADVLDLSVTAGNLDISDINKYFPEKYLYKISDYNPSGILTIDSKIKGLMTRTANPRMDIKFNLTHGSVTYGNSALKINDLSFKGFFTNGPGMVPKTSSLSFTDIKGALGSAQYSGTLNLSDFDALNGDLLLKGRIIPAELKEFFAIKNISYTSGTVDFNLRMKGYIPKKEKYTISDIFTLKPDADLRFNSFGIGFSNDRLKVSNVQGALQVSDSVTADNLKFVYKEHEIGFEGVVRNLPGWLSGKPVMLAVKGDVTCNELLPEKLFGGPPGADTSSAQKRAFLFPDDIAMNLKYKIRDFNYQTFSAENITGDLTYKPHLINIKALKLNSLDGMISGNGFIVQNKDKSFIGRGSFNLEKINVNKAFISFRNFGQDFIKSENLAGSLSGSLSVLIPMDSLMNPVIKSISAEGKYILENGSLINFEPVKELSDFIELSELENIKFEKLENDFFIRNNTVYIPMMDVRSSAADLAVNGKHTFDDDYEYHVKILLSEMLSKKISKPKPNTTEFGAVKDDGLGRTSMLLKIVNKGEDVKVTYDVKTAGNQIKNDIKTERQTLKTILKEEYGWYKNDTAANRKPATGTPRFKITWDETDTVKTESEPPPAKNEDPIKKLFRKK